MPASITRDSEILAANAPLRGFHRQARFDIFAYNGARLGDTWAFSARDAAALTGAAYAKAWR